MKNKKPSIILVLQALLTIIIGFVTTYLAYKFSAPLRATEDKAMLGFAFPVIGLIVVVIGIFQLIFEIKAIKDRRAVKNFHKSFDYEEVNENLENSKEDTFANTHPLKESVHFVNEEPPKVEKTVIKRSEPTSQVNNYSYCPYCGKELKNKYIYCPYCGSKID